MIRTNIRPYVLFTKYGTLHFKEHAHTHTNKVAMIHTASIASDLCTPWGGVYSGTKRYNEVFADLSSRQSKKSFDYKNLMVTQILKNRPLNETSFYDLPHKLKSKNHRKNATMTPIDLATASNMYLPPPS